MMRRLATVITVLLAAFLVSAPVGAQDGSATPSAGPTFSASPPAEPCPPEAFASPDSSPAAEAPAPASGAIPHAPPTPDPCASPALDPAPSPQSSPAAGSSGWRRVFEAGAIWGVFPAKGGDMLVIGNESEKLPRSGWFIARLDRDGREIGRVGNERGTLDRRLMPLGVDRRRDEIVMRIIPRGNGSPLGTFVHIDADSGRVVHRVRPRLPGDLERQFPGGVTVDDQGRIFAAYNVVGAATNDPWAPRILRLDADGSMDVGVDMCMHRWPSFRTCHPWVIDRTYGLGAGRDGRLLLLEQPSEYDTRALRKEGIRLTPEVGSLTLGLGGYRAIDVTLPDWATYSVTGLSADRKGIVAIGDLRYALIERRAKRVPGEYRFRDDYGNLARIWDTRVRLFDARGRHLATFDLGSGNGGPDRPRGPVFDDEGRLWVLDWVPSGPDAVMVLADPAGASRAGP